MPSPRTPIRGHPSAPLPVASTESTALQPQEALPALIAELRACQAELEAQNKVLQYSQAAAESASERFEALFSSVPLAPLVLDEYDMVVQANAMAHRSFQPTEAGPPADGADALCRRQRRRPGARGLPIRTPPAGATVR